MATNDQNSHCEPSVPDDAPGRDFSFPSGFLEDSLAARKDISMLSNILTRRRFGLSHETKQRLICLLCRIAEKQYVDVVTSDGIQQIDGPADKTAVMAMKVLALFEQIDQKDAHKLIDIELKRIEKPSSGTTINIGAVGNMSLGQEPLSAEHAKQQALEILERVKSRTKPPEPAPIVVQNKLESKLDDLEEL